MHLTWKISSYEVYSVIIPILQMEKLRLLEIKCCPSLHWVTEPRFKSIYAWLQIFLLSIVSIWDRVGQGQIVGWQMFFICTLLGQECGGKGPNKMLLSLRVAMAWSRLPQNPCVEALTLNVIVFGDRDFRKQLRLNEVIGVRSSVDRTGGLLRRGGKRALSLSMHMYQGKAMWANNEKVESASQKERTWPCWHPDLEALKH